jgi:DNA-binding transcriptional ArsR family regulator
MSSTTTEQGQDLYKALAHPLRREILAHLIEHSSASPSQMSKVIDAPLPAISHHAKQLVKYGAAELAEERPTRRGSPEHVYRPAARAHLMAEEVERMPASDRQVFAEQIVRRMMKDLRKGFERGSFSKNADWALLHNVLDLDPPGFQKLLELQNRVQEEVFEIQAESDARRVGEPSMTVRVSAAQVAFATDT